MSSNASTNYKIENIVLSMGKNLYAFLSCASEPACLHTLIHVCLCAQLCTHTQSRHFQDSAQHTHISHDFLLPKSRLSTGGFIIASIKMTTIFLLQNNTLSDVPPSVLFRTTARCRLPPALAHYWKNYRRR